jgi:hypothetical protein
MKEIRSYSRPAARLFPAAFIVHCRLRRRAVILPGGPDVCTGTDPSGLDQDFYCYSFLTPLAFVAQTSSQLHPGER